MLGDGHSQFEAQIMPILEKSSSEQSVNSETKRVPLLTDECDSDFSMNILIFDRNLPSVIRSR